jgi:hypothetical protein
VNRRLSRIRSTVVATLAVAAVAAPAALADTPTGQDQLAISGGSSAGQIVGDPVGDRVRPLADAQVAGDPVSDRVRAAAPVDVTAPAAPAAQPNEFDWLDAGIGAGGLALLVLVGAGAAKGVRTRRTFVRPAA